MSVLRKFVELIFENFFHLIFPFDFSGIFFTWIWTSSVDLLIFLSFLYYFPFLWCCYCWCFPTFMESPLSLSCELSFEFFISVTFKFPRDLQQPLNILFSCSVSSLKIFSQIPLRIAMIALKKISEYQFSFVPTILALCLVMVEALSQYLLLFPVYSLMRKLL